MSALLKGERYETVPPGSPKRELMAAAVGYALITTILTWPIIVSPDQYVISEFMDVVAGFYNPWWFHKALVELHQSPWTSPLIDYPYGYSMVLYPVWVPYDLICLPFVHIAGIEGLPVVFNLVILAAFVARGLSGFACVRYVTENPGASFFAGLVAAFSPFVMWNLTRWHVTCLELVLPCLYFYIRTLRENNTRTAAAFTVFCALIAYTSPNYSADMVLAIPLITILLYFSEPGFKPNLAVAKKLGLAFTATFVICLPLIIRLAMEILGSGAPVSQDESVRIKFSANLIGLVTPGTNLQAYSSLAPRLPYPDEGLGREHGIGGYEIFLGYSVIALAAIGAASRWKKALPFIGLAALFLLLSMGPAFHAGRFTASLAAPYRYLEALLPWLKVERAPVRHMGLVMAAMAVLAGLGLARLSEFFDAKWRRPLYVLTALIVSIEYNQAPLKLDRIPIPDFVYEIRDDPSPGSVLDIPYLPVVKRIGGIHQMYHEKPLVYQLTRRRDDPRYLEGTLFKYFDRPGKWPSMQDERKEEALDELRGEFVLRDLRYVCAYPRFMEPEDVKGLETMMRDAGALRTLVENDKYIVYQLVPRR